MRFVSIVLLSLFSGIALGVGLAFYRVYSRPYDPDKLVQLINADPLGADSPEYNQIDSNAPELALPTEIEKTARNIDTKNEEIGNPNLPNELNFFKPKEDSEGGLSEQNGSQTNDSAAAPDAPKNDQESNKTTLNAGRARPHLEVDRLFQFGVLQNGETGEHKFVLKNTGNAPLHISVDETSCKCTAAELGNGRVAPGMSTEILVTWKTADFIGNYSQRVLIKTNDPDLPLLELEVHGKIVADARAIPSEVSFAAATYQQSATAQINLFCYKNPPLKIKKARFLDPAASGHFQVDWVSAPQNLIDREADATAGYTLTLTLKNSLPLGPFQQILVLETDSPLQPEIRVPIHGKISGALSVAGPGWDEERKTWILGILDRGATATKTLWIIDRSPKAARGANASTDLPAPANTEAASSEAATNVEPQPKSALPGVKLEIEKVEPEWLKVQLQDPVYLPDAGIVRTVIQLTVPPNAPVCDYWGQHAEQKGQILLKTSSKESKTLLIYLRFAVKNKE